MNAQEAPERLYRISTIAKMLDIQPTTARKYLREYGTEIRDTPVGQRVTQTELDKFINRFYGKKEPQ